jgi:hypothetical protein
VNGISSESLNMNRMDVRGGDRRRTHFPPLQILKQTKFASHVSAYSVESHTVSSDADFPLDSEGYTTLLSAADCGHVKAG